MKARRTPVIVIAVCLVLGLSLALPSSGICEYKPKYISAVFGCKMTWAAVAQRAQSNGKSRCLNFPSAAPRGGKGSNINDKKSFSEKSGLAAKFFLDLL